MIRLLLALLLRVCLCMLAILAIAWPTDAASMTGYAARYSSEAKMRRAARIHGVDVPNGMEVCASPHHALGTVITVRSARRKTAWRCIVGDVAHARDRAAIIERGIVIEVTPRGAMRLCGSVKDPPRQCPVTVERAG